MKKICVITGSRAEYGLLYWLMKDLQQDPEFKLQVVATGMHLSPEYGLTFQDIERDGFIIDKKVEMLLSADTPSSISKSTGLGMIGIADVFADLQPDLVILLGDRYEILAAAFAALVARIPIAHIHGGEKTAGAFDEAIRHSISKMAWWHFVANDEYKQRVIQLGEAPDRVFNVGGLGVDGIVKTNLLSKFALEAKMGFQFKQKNLLVTFHPVTLDKASSEEQFDKLLNCLEKLDNTLIILTHPNSDTDGRILKKRIEVFVKKHPDNSIAFTSMGQKNYLSTLQYIDAVIGNSSSGIIEAPSFRIGTVNIGDRQQGRLMANSVISCKPDFQSITLALKKLYSDEFQKGLNTMMNPYGEGGASEAIIKILKKEAIPPDIKKEFYDL
jgi:GDP/UDP-N,N'-diacetylbacillosamine 2-epimerase (hydrolysing)